MSFILLFLLYLKTYYMNIFSNIFIKDMCYTNLYLRNNGFDSEGIDYHFQENQTENEFLKQKLQENYEKIRLWEYLKNEEYSEPVRAEIATQYLDLVQQNSSYVFKIKGGGLRWE